MRTITRKRMESCTSTTAYFMREPNETEGQRTALRDSDNNVTINDLLDAGVLAYKVDMKGDWEKEVEKYSEKVGMKNRDIVRINPVSMNDFEKKMKVFFEEHLHTDPEVRFVIEGSGYFDIRDKKDRWIRIPVSEGDLLFLPAGIYHRFTTDEKDSVVAMRFFKDLPRWEAHNRKETTTEELPERQQYLRETSAH